MVHRQFPAVLRTVRGTTLGKVSSYTLQPIGFIRSTLKRREDAPRQGTEGAPDAWLEIEPRFAEALLGMEAGHELIVITWLQEAKRDVLKNHPRRDAGRPVTGVFYTRSPARPTKEKRPSLISPGDARSSSSTISCLGPTTKLGVRPAQPSPTASTASQFI